MSTAVHLTGAIEHVLHRLTETQNDDGSWGKGKNRVSSTALAVLCFIGEGHTHRIGLHKNTVKKGLSALKNLQQESGGFGDGVSNRRSFLAAMALGEVYAVTRDYRIKAPTESAMKYVISLQRADGGFSDSKDGNSDCISTALAILAIKACKTGGLEVPEECFKKAKSYFAGLTGKEGNVGYAKKGDGGVVPGRPKEFSDIPLTTASAGIAAIFAGRPRKELSAQRTLVSKTGIERKKPAGRDSLYIYFGTYFLFQYFGKEWSTHLKSLAKLIDKSLVRQGEKQGTYNVDDPWSKEYGEFWTGCFFVLAAEIGARYIRATGNKLAKLEDIPPLLRLLESPVPGCRSSGASILGQVARNSEKRKLLVNLLAHKSASVREAAVNAFCEAGATELASRIVPLLRDKSKDVRMAVSFNISKLKAAGVVRQVAGIAKDSTLEQNCRVEATRALGEIAGDESVNELILLLKDTNLQVRGMAGYALGDTMSRKALLPLIEAIRSEPEEGFLGCFMRSEYCHALKKITTEADLSMFKKLLSDPDENVRREAAAVIGALKGKDARKTLIEALKHDDWRVVSNAASALADKPDEEAIKALIKALRHPDDTARGFVVDALEEITDKRAALPLVVLLASSCDIRNSWKRDYRDLLGSYHLLLVRTENSLCWKAARAIAKLGNREPGPAVVKMLANPYEHARASAAWVLGEMHIKAAANDLKGALTDKSALVRAFAAAALVRLGDRSALEALLQAMVASEPYERYEALRAGGDVRERGLIPVYIFLLGDEDILVRFRVHGRLAYLTGRKPSVSVLELSEKKWEQEMESWKEWWDTEKEFLRWREEKPCLYPDENAKKKKQPVDQFSGEPLDAEAIKLRRSHENKMTKLLQRSPLTLEQAERLRKDKTGLKKFFEE